ncbi:phosphatase PAP2 family protein [Fertoebacter nigrum]|uniref:Phosphatase PAP2 family protein n=1 Tax=Fertoeibacter niger TaxID=2656921 RepID=A0A8X8KPK6_9RHOB|nr:phosphatase PAP2 family protein [Fertoeibacter niger]NUB43072.1 phosphatase PAP2 family protein [Fertoeibacter niger]
MSLGLRLFIVFALVHLGFAIWPEVDLAVSRLFHRPTEGFPLAAHPGLGALRYLLWNLTLLAPLVALAGWCIALMLNRQARVLPRVWGFALACFVTGPVLVADTLFKSHWGRARPADVAEFGGMLPFTPPFEMAGNCARNCSFVSGEGAGIAMLAFVIGVLGWHLVPRPLRRRFALGLLVLAVIGGGLRVATGRHFLSDVVFAWFFMGFVVLVLYRAMGMAEARHSLTLVNLRADLGAFRAGLRAMQQRPR